MEIIRSPRIMHDTVMGQTQRSRTVGLVPTMGALHKGHMSLIRQSRMEDNLTAVSIFINPTQFGPSEDFENYPRDIDADINALRQADVDYLFMPAADEMYPKGFDLRIDPGTIATRLCGASRPGHFSGVATVVAKLLNIVIPDRAYFGQKDYQQTVVLKHMARGLNIPTEIVSCPTIREDDGLAMSSRNTYLTDPERAAAPALYKGLRAAEKILKDGGSVDESQLELIETLGSESLISEIQYSGVYNIDTLDELDAFQGKALLAAAIKIGKTRLIDNIVIV